MENQEEKTPKKTLTVFLISTTMLLSLACLCAGIYSLYISIGFRFLNRSAIGGLNTSALYTFSNSSYGTGGGTMVGLILVSLVMLALGIAMAIIFFKQMPLYKQIKLIAKMPNVKYKDYSKQAKKSVIVFSIIGYIVCIAFTIFAIVVVFRSGISSNYVWIVAGAFAIVLILSIASMVLMFLKLSQLSKIKKTLKQNELLVDEAESDNKISEKNKKQKDDYKNKDRNIDQNQNLSLNRNTQNPSESLESLKTQVLEKSSENKLFTDGIFELNSQLQKLREMHISGLIDSSEYTQIREKWIDAVLSEPLFGKKKTKTKTLSKQKDYSQSKLYLGEYDSKQKENDNK